MDEDTKACLMHFAKALDNIEARLDVIGHVLMHGYQPGEISGNFPTEEELTSLKDKKKEA